ncbi:hypothetical protein FA15DRAFT_141745 [Coprinopsis marcescibilis]|uniref:Uncharacterized protein n=1 Tax=Coprinopsis marcescibilis TaxID=230819 RepID=A0A5C3KJ68_COPMA|nr:hypothetical protein FA15DRAFT_141745 [Coprinopsis marcescibilis]
MKFSIGLLIAATLAAPVFANIAAQDVQTRDIEELDLFGRAAVDVLNDIYGREELQELLGREFDDDYELTARDIEDLLEREVEVDESLVSRDVATAAVELESRFFGLGGTA